MAARLLGERSDLVGVSSCAVLCTLGFCTKRSLIWQLCAQLAEYGSQSIIFELLSIQSQRHTSICSLRFLCFFNCAEFWPLLGLRLLGASRRLGSRFSVEGEICAVVVSVIVAASMSLVESVRLLGNSKAYLIE